MPNNNSKNEHFVTYFDSRFLVVGLALYNSLKMVMPHSHLWVVCIDDVVKRHLQKMELKDVSIIPLTDIETPELLAVKTERTLGEYCWTITPFVASAVFDADSTLTRVTYVDADLYFFSTPEPFFREFDESQKQVLITEHGYGPGFDRSKKSGRFCVQYITFRKSDEAMAVLKWWQERCVEWCFDRVEDGKFGDQKYLDQWPIIFKDVVHILSQLDKTLAPWNANYYLAINPKEHVPVFYHFQSFRIVGNDLARLYMGAQLDRNVLRFYFAYLSEIRKQVKLMNDYGISLIIMPEPVRRFKTLRNLYSIFTKRVRYEKLYASE